MKNIYDYILNYQNKEIDEITPVDAMIFARISYIHFENIIDKIPMKLSELVFYLDAIKTNAKDKKLIEMLSSTKRFQNIEVIRCQNILDNKKEEQFLAITLSLGKTLFIAFRGTSKNIIGYKEDLNMSFMTIPSQLDALKYVNEEKGIKPIYLGGHSKGGNLAMYAGIHANVIKSKLIKKIYNFDGPGFLELDNKFYKIKKKIINYYPENDIVGMLMKNDNKFIPIVSNKKGIEAHNMYHWSIINDDLELGEIKENSLQFHDACIKLIDNINITKRKIIIDYIFELVMQGEIKGVKELKLEDIKKYINNVPKIDKDDKELLMQFMKCFFKCLI